MEATYFVKKFGLTNAAFFVSGTELENLVIYVQCGWIMHTDQVNVADINRVIESHALIEKLGGLTLAKKHTTDTRVQQAIKDVEQSI